MTIKKTRNSQNWQQALAQVITNPDELCSHLALDKKALVDAHPAIQQFPLRVPRGFVSRIKKGDLNDPLLLQILPQGIETQNVPGFSKDPVGEQNVNPIPGLLHKYKGRVLLTLSGSCAIHCRYCFRRHFPYAENNPGKNGWNKALEYISQDKGINEVILSGGDPLVVKDDMLREFISALEKITHLKRLRIHTRLPIVIPERITEQFIKSLTQTRLQPVIVFHCNHANEIDDSVMQAFNLLRAANITLLNQSVLLKGINDSVSALVNLSETLFNSGVLPYYLHLLDPVQGSAHFFVEEQKASELVWQLMQELPGYLVPKLVKEVAGAPAKIQLGIMMNCT